MAQLAALAASLQQNSAVQQQTSFNPQNNSNFLQGNQQLQTLLMQTQQKGISSNSNQQQNQPSASLPPQQVNSILQQYSQLQSQVPSTLVPSSQYQQPNQYLPPSSQSSFNNPQPTNNYIPYLGGSRNDRVSAPASRTFNSAQSRRSPPRKERSPPRRERKRSRSPPQRSRTPPRHSRRKSRSKTPPPKSKDHSSDKDHHSHKEKEKKYTSSIKNYSLVDSLEGYNSIQQKHKNLVIPDSFVSSKSRWVSSLSEEYQFESSYIPFHVDSSQKKSPSSLSTSNESEEKIIINAKVILPLGMLDNTEKPKNPTSQIKFLVGKKEKSIIVPFGGKWSKELDGGNPLEEDEALIRTATRIIKDQIMLDLSQIKQWTRFLEINYQHEDREEHTIILLPDLSSILPNYESFVELWNQHHSNKMETKKEEQKEDIKEEIKEETTGEEETKSNNAAVESVEASVQQEGLESKQQNEVKKEEKIPDPPSTSRLLLTPITIDVKEISLNGLLDYNDKDKDRETFEVSLFAEQFEQMLQRQYGLAVQKILFKWSEKETKVVASSENSEAEKSEQKEVSDLIGLRSFQFFDRNLCGYIPPDDLVSLIHSLTFLPHWNISNVVNKAMDSQLRRIYYQRLVESSREEKQNENENTEETK
eukprot:TRINITY_DN4796_c0_g2_i1.p1 TRINITY_DN4796_c0_g2~~TRINITY_DN4796_c0_g2_i1.p1  ORF type:complete len:645 (-),score=243.52 TRINITY_DN4796_c0_g2_i1:36-1970(-)